MKFRLVDAEKVRMPIARMYALLGVSVSGYHAWRRRGPSRRQLDDMVFLAYIRTHFALSNGTYGSPRMHVELCEEGLTIGRHRVARLMRDNGLRPNQKRRFKKTTDSQHGGPIAPNILDRILQRVARTRNGGSISAMSGRPKVGCIWPSFLISSPGGSSAGRSAIA